MTGPNAREWKVLQILSGGAAENRGGFPPGIGEPTLAGMVAKGWIEPAPTGGLGRPSWGITALGEKIYATGRPKPRRSPTRLKSMPARLGEMSAHLKPLK